MSTTQFPLVTQDAQPSVTLPVGKHTLRLVVTDDTGAESAADMVEIIVEKSGAPIINHIDPSDGQRGKTFEAVMVGVNLDNVTAIKVFSGSHEDQRITVTPRAGGTSERLPVVIHIFDHARLGPRMIEVTTRRGIATVAFNVVSAEVPRIINLTPTWAAVGHLRPLPARVEGDHLENASLVTFLLAGASDDKVKAAIRQANTEFLDLDIAVAVDAVFGRRAFTVTAPAGTATSPTGVTLQVLPGIVQIGVMVLAVVAALIHVSLQFPDPLFLLNGLGYLGLLALLYLPLRWLSGGRAWFRWMLILYTAITIIAWVVMGDRQSALAYIALVVEVALLGLLFVENYQASAKH